MLAKALENEGIDAFHISGGDHHTMIHQTSPMAMDHGHNVWAAEAIKKVVSVPVIASGSINTPELAEEVIASGKGDFVGLGRPLWADPSGLRSRGRPPRGHPSLHPLQRGLPRAHLLLLQGRQLRAQPADQPRGRAGDHPAAVKKNIAVVGGGPAGLEAARVLSLRGHSVTVFEKGELGGSSTRPPSPSSRPTSAA